MKVTVTRKSKVGFGYNASAEQVWNDSMTHSWLRPSETTKPDHIGTILQVEKAVEGDRTLASFRSGGTYYTTAWFVKVSGKWRKIKNTDENNYSLHYLTLERDREDYKYDGRKYYQDSVEVEVEE